MLQCASRMGLKGCILSYEMTPSQLRLRMAKGLFGNVPQSDFVPDRLDMEKAKQLYADYEQQVLTGQVFDPEIKRLRDSSLDYLLEYIREMRAWGYRWIVLDNLQKIRVQGVSSSDYAARMEAICFALRDEVEMERDHENFVLVSLSQINRTASANRFQTPSIYDTLGGSAIESSANVVLVLDHTRQYYDNMKKASRNWVILGKNTDGPRDIEIPFEYSWQHRKMREGMPDELDQDPALGGWPKTPEGDGKRR